MLEPFSYEYILAVDCTTEARKPKNSKILQKACNNMYRQDNGLWVNAEEPGL